MVLRILFAGLIGAAACIIGRMTVRQLGRRTKKAVPEESRIAILQKYSGYDRRKVRFRHSVKMVLNRPIPEILNKYNYSVMRSLFRIVTL